MDPFPGTELPRCNHSAALHPGLSEGNRRASPPDTFCTFKRQPELQVAGLKLPHNLSE